MSCVYIVRLFYDTIKCGTCPTPPKKELINSITLVAPTKPFGVVPQLTLMLIGRDVEVESNIDLNEIHRPMPNQPPLTLKNNKLCTFELIYLD